MCPSKKICLSFSASKCDLSWKQGFYRSNHVKMRSLGLALIQHNWCYKKGKSGQRDRNSHKEDDVKASDLGGTSAS